MTQRFSSIALLFALLITISSCDKDDNIAKNTALIQSYNANYVAIVGATYSDSYNKALEMHQAIEAFIAAPDANKFEICKTKWLEARNPYGQTEAFRFYGGPIDDENGPEGLINAWPIDESFIDYVQGNESSGLINDPIQYPVISKDVLAELNESISETSIFTGYHAIEFLLWGQDFSASGPGSRSYTDYTTAPNASRRAEYLVTVSSLLLDNLKYVRDFWIDGGSYAKTFLNRSGKSNLELIFTSLGELSKGELAGERMIVAVDSDDQENEHSCFSDNTVNDIKMNFLGIQNVLLGKYQKVNGETISGQSLVAIGMTYDNEKAQKVILLLKQTNDLINLIPSPFDQAILTDKEPIINAAQSLRNLSDAIADMGFKITSLED